MEEELSNVKRKKLEVESLITSMRADIEKYSVEATQRNNLKEIKMLLQKADTLSKIAQQKVDVGNELDNHSSQQRLAKIENIDSKTLLYPIHISYNSFTLRYG